MANQGKRSALSSAMVSAKETGPAASLSDARRIAGSAVPPPNVPDQVLASKGAASASGFKPWYWSYEQEGEAAPAENTARVMPFPASTAAAAPRDAATAPAPEPRSSPDEAKTREGMPFAKLLLGLACVALAVTAAPILYPWSHGGGENPRSQPMALQPAAPAPAPPQTAIASPAPAIAVAPEPSPAVAEAPASIPSAATVETPAPAPEPQAIQSAAPKPSPQEIAEFLERGDQLLATGDVSTARVFYERAAEQGNAKAAMSLGKTYDPLFLDRLPTRGVRSDIARALDWYRKAAAVGEPQAEAHIIRLMAKRPG